MNNISRESVHSIACQQMMDEIYAVSFHQLPEVFFRTDAKSKLKWITPNIEVLLGFEAEELIGKPIAALFREKKNYKLAINKFKQAKGEVRYHYKEVKKADGSIVWLEGIGCSLFDDDGKFAGIQGVVRDVSEHIETKKILEENQEHLRCLSDVAQEAILVHKNGIVADCNKSFRELLGYEEHDIKGRRTLDFVAYGDRKLVADNIENQCQNPYEIHMLDRKGREIPVEVISQNTAIGDRSIRITSIRDLTVKKESEAHLNKLSRAIEQSPIGVLILDEKAVVEYVNPSYLKMLDQDDIQVLDNQIFRVYGGYARAVLEEMWENLQYDGEWRGEIQNQRADGSFFWEQVYASRVEYENRTTHYIILVEDATVRKEQETKILQQAYFDPLTNLPNRNLGMDRLAQEIQASKRSERMTALMFVDLDEFKPINDTLGHEYGDEFLKGIAERLSLTVRGVDTVARFGGDEFFVVLGELSSMDDVEVVANKLMKAFSTPFKVGEQEISLTASIGVSIYPQDGETPADLLKSADTAMYASKVQGRNRYTFFTAEMSRMVKDRMAMESQMRKAITRDEFYIHFQPKVDVVSRKIVGVEALCRWYNPQTGLIPPTKFIPLAEATGMIVEIGRKVLFDACEAASRWRRDGHGDVLISVNVSPRQFKEPDFIATVERALEHSGLPAHLLDIEVTEGLLLTKRIQTENTINRLKTLGVKLSIDDFGTGYSSMVYLENFPFDTIKIDRVFVDDMFERKKRMVLLNTIIAMGKGLGLEVVAEGVEDEDQYDHLLEQGCDLIQGFLFSKPVSEKDLVKMLNKTL